VKVAFINGSPRKNNGITARLLRVMEERLPGCEIVRGWEEPCDALLIAFPLYVDGIPSNMLRELIAHERGLPPGTRVYVLVNNGFYEGEQNAVAISMLRNWCVRAGLAWGQGVGIGAGEILKREPVMKMASVMARGSLKRYRAALDALAGHILAKEGGETLYTRPGMPRALYMFGGDISFRVSAKKNGLTKRDMARKL